MRETSHQPDPLDVGETIRGINTDMVFFDRFKTERVLGRGGMGVVWLAYDQKLKVPVALKFMPEIVAADDASLDDLRKETRNGLHLSHPNLVRMLDLVEDTEEHAFNHVAAIVMEYVDGPNMAQLMLQQPTGVFEVRSIETWIHQMVDALEYAHSQAKMIHRDLKPNNLMVNSQDQLKIADFGIADCVRDSVSRVSVKSVVNGALPYMCPQHLGGDYPAVSHDIYSFGATLYEFLTSRPPFYTGDIPMQIANKIPSRMAQRRLEFGIQGEPIPEAWEEVVASCLEKDPINRPASMTEVRKGLLGQKFARGSGSTKARAARNPSKDPTPISSEAIAKFAAVSILLSVAVAGWYYGSFLPTKIMRQQVAQEKMEAELKESRRLQLKIDSLADYAAKVRTLRSATFDSAREAVVAWEELESKYATLEIPGNAELEQLHASVRREKRSASSEEKREQTRYTYQLSDLRSKLDRIQAQDERNDLGASQKQKAWQTILETWPHKDLNSEYGTEHLLLLRKVKQSADSWRLAAAKERPVAPLTLPELFAAPMMATWKPYGRNTLLKKVKGALLNEGRYNGPVDERYDDVTHQAILAFQDAEELPATGKLDSITLSRLGVDASVEPQPLVVAAASAPRKPTYSGTASRTQPRTPPPQPELSGLEKTAAIMGIIGSAVNIRSQMVRR